LGHNSIRTINSSTNYDFPLNYLSGIFGIDQDTSKQFTLTQFGNFTANFRPKPFPIPSEYWIPLYGVIVSTIVGWSIPTI
jgi:hypothetical protein